MLRPGGKCLVLFLAYNDGFESYLRLGNNPRYKPYMKVIKEEILTLLKYKFQRL